MIGRVEETSASFEARSAPRLYPTAGGALASLPRRRREFITLLGGATAWPLAARAQQSAMPVVGFLYPGVPELSTGVVAAFRKGLAETGFAEGRNVAVEFRFECNDNTRLLELAADLVRRRVAVITTPGSTPSALAAKAATTTIIIAFGIGPDAMSVLGSALAARSKQKEMFVTAMTGEARKLRRG